MQSSGCEPSEVDFSCAQLTSQLETPEVQAGVEHSRFVDDDSEDDSNVGCGVSWGTLVARKAHFFLLRLGSAEVPRRKI